jgi:hypothetical protein
MSARGSTLLLPFTSSFITLHHISPRAPMGCASQLLGFYRPNRGDVTTPSRTHPPLLPPPPPPACPPATCSSSDSQTHGRIYAPLLGTRERFHRLQLRVLRPRTRAHRTPKPSYCPCPQLLQLCPPWRARGKSIRPATAAGSIVVNRMDARGYTRHSSDEHGFILRTSCQGEGQGSGGWNR